MTFKELQAKLEKKVVANKIDQKINEAKAYFEEHKSSIEGYVAIAGCIGVGYMAGRGIGYCRGFIDGTGFGVKLTTAFVEAIAKSTTA